MPIDQSKFHQDNAAAARLTQQSAQPPTPQPTQQQTQSAPASKPEKSKPFNSPLDTIKPGSESKHVELPHDFGARPDHTAEALYASQAALNQDKGRGQTRSNDETGGVRQAGAGTRGQASGAGSGGDLDTDVIGLGGRGLAANIPTSDERVADGPDRIDGVDVSKAASGKPAAGENQSTDEVGVSNDIPRGGTVTYERDDENDEIDVEGADAIRTTDPNDPFADAAAGEVSRGESAGPSDASSSSGRP
jgi:hypothetical protein